MTTEEKDLYQTIFQSMHEPAFVMDRNMRITEANRAFDDFFSLCPAQYSNRKFDEVIVFYRRGRNFLPAQAFKKGRPYFRAEAAIRTTAGKKTLTISWSALDNGSGKPEGWIVLLKDITVRKKAEDELKRRRRQLQNLAAERTAEMRTAINFLTDEIEMRKRSEEALRENEARMLQQHGMKVLGEMAGGIAHEVRNPLHALMSVTEALGMALRDNSDVDEYIFHIRTQVKRLSTLMNDLLELGKPVEPSRLRRESVADICSAAIALWRQSAADKAREVKLVLPEDQSGLFVEADSRRMQQVFINLLDNASHHSLSEDEIKVVLHGPSAGLIKVHVSDSGSGIPQELLPRIFEPFFTTRKGGTGLGLTIIKNIIECHGGSMSVFNNASRRGCTAEVSLPAAGEALAEEMSAEEMSDGEMLK